MKFCIFFNKYFRSAIIGLLILFINSSGYAQGRRIELQTGIGTYQMNQLKRFNAAIDLPFHAELVADFPPYVYFQPSFFFLFQNFELGSSYAFHSTGSRTSRKDYSGEYYLDLNLQSHSLGIIFEKTLSNINSFELQFYTEANAMLTFLYLREFLQIGNEVISEDKIEVISFNLNVEPGFSVSYRMTNLLFKFMAGYVIQVYNGPFHLSGNRKAILVDSNNEKVYPDWSGFRIALAIGYQYH